MPAISTAVATKPDTIPDDAYLGVRLFKDSLIYDGIMLGFNHTASVNYVVDEDAPYFMGFGKVSLASISGDGMDLAINKMPYKPGMEIGLDVHAKASGIYFLSVNYEKEIPSNIQVWLQDNYLKVTINITVHNYSFRILKDYPNSFGAKRFKIILKGGGQ